MRPIVTINGKEIKNLHDSFYEIGIVANFEDEVQPDLSVSNLEFGLDGFKEIQDWAKGNYGVFEGCPFKISFGADVPAFDGVIDLSERYEVNQDMGTVSVSVKQRNSLNRLEELLAPLDFGYLRDIGAIKTSDYVNVPYIVERPDKWAELAMLAIGSSLAGYQLYTLIEKYAKDGAITAAIAPSGVTGPVGAALYAALIIIINIAYAVSLILVLARFLKRIIEVLAPIPRFHKGVALQTLLEKTCSHIGYGFETTITDLDKFVFLPSNNNAFNNTFIGNLTFGGDNNIIREGIPHIGDPGYSVPEFFNICKDLFFGRFAIIGEKVHFHTDLNPIWFRRSGFKMPGVYRGNRDNVDQLGRVYRYNTEDLKASLYVKFATDISDDWTFENYKGTAYQVLTSPNNVKDIRNLMVKNLDEARIPWALGNRADERTLKFLSVPLRLLIRGVNAVANLLRKKSKDRKFGKGTDGSLKVARNNFAVPKLLYLSGGKIPSNHRDVLSAKTLYDNYHVEKSFLYKNGKRQRRVVDEEAIPFGHDDFLQVLDSPFFKTSDGSNGKITRLEWTFDSDVAIISYWVEERYAKNLKEEHIEP